MGIVVGEVGLCFLLFRTRRVLGVEKVSRSDEEAEGVVEEVEDDEAVTRAA
jgi:hypothetical protein